MREARDYYWRLLGAAIPHSLSHWSTWATVVLAIALPITIHLFGENGGLSAAMTLWLTWGTLLAVVLFRLARAPYVLYRQDKYIHDALERRAAAAVHHQGLADELNAFHETGLGLRNETMFKAMYNGWKERCDAWHQAMRDCITTRFSATKADSVLRLNAYAPMNFPDSMHAEHNKRKTELTYRLENVAALRDEMLARAPVLSQTTALSMYLQSQVSDAATGHEIGTPQIEAALMAKIHANGTRHSVLRSHRGYDLRVREGYISLAPLNAGPC
jgi:hypothetical protein